MNEITKDGMQGKIVAMEQEMFQHPEAQVELEVVHHFSNGVYARELHIPAGVLLSGKVHKFENLNIISQGDITVWTDEGMKRIQAPFTLVSTPGAKRIGYAHTDTVWITIHATESRDLEEIEAQMVCETFEEYQQFLGHFSGLKAIGG